jgi:DNA polymerase-3 subunit delta
MEFAQIQKQVQSRKFAPLYYFYGDEPYFIDQLTKLVEENALNPGEEAFNKSVVYGGDVEAPKLLNELRSFPMLSQRRLVVLKEAQRMNKNVIEKITPYLENPLDSTVFVMAFKGGKIDGRSKAVKLLKEKGVVFESKPLYENQVAGWISQHLKEKGYQAKPEALNVMVAYLGANLGLITNEIEKIMLYLKGRDSDLITPEVVYEMINVDKDFNVFELMNVLGSRDHSRSHFIVSQMMRNVKDNPPILIVNQLFQFFNKLTLCRSAGATTEKAIAETLGISPFIAKQYAAGLRSYNTRELHRNLVLILEADLFLKGVQPTHMSQEHILKTMIFKLLN